LKADRRKDESHGQRKSTDWWKRKDDEKKPKGNGRESTKRHLRRKGSVNSLVRRGIKAADLSYVDLCRDAKLGTACTPRRLIVRVNTHSPQLPAKRVVLIYHENKSISNHKNRTKENFGKDH